MLFEIGKFWKTGLKRGKMGRKGGVKEKFSIWRFRLKKVKKHTFLRQPWAASPQHCQCVFRKLRKSCKDRASRTQWPSGPAVARATPIADFALGVHVKPLTDAFIVLIPACFLRQSRPERATEYSTRPGVTLRSPPSVLCRPFRA